jgi:hypothetical protein
VRRLLTLMMSALGFTALGAVAPAVGSAAPTVPAAHHATAAAPGGNPVVAWNTFLLDLQATPGVQPATIHPTYDLALTQAAIYDAVVSIDHSTGSYGTTVFGPPEASRKAALDAAAHSMLAALYPAQRHAIDARYRAMLAPLPHPGRVAEGIHVGRRVAAQLLARRTDDGSGVTPPTFDPGNGPGGYQLTPPTFSQPVFTHWPGVRPFVLHKASQFRPPAPPSLTSAKYAAAINEVKTLGEAQGSTRTADQTQIGQFWNPPIWAFWNRIAQSAVLGHHAGLDRSARTFAALDLTFADSAIAFYDAKYTYRFWRPVTAIQNADTDGNPDTVADGMWSPLSNTAPDPSYPGAHGTISAAGADVLSAIYGNDFSFTVTSPALPGVTRSFVSFSEAAEEASVSRIYNGNHTRLDEVAGENLGQDVAGYVLGHALGPVQ